MDAISLTTGQSLNAKPLLVARELATHYGYSLIGEPSCPDTYLGNIAHY